jgi:hypothetical protein
MLATDERRSITVLSRMSRLPLCRRLSQASECSRYADFFISGQELDGAEPVLLVSPVWLQIILAVLSHDPPSRGANSRRPGSHLLRRNGLLQAHAPGSSPNVVRRHLKRARRSALRMGAVEFSRTVRCSRYAARRHKVRRLARPPAQKKMKE